MKQPALLSLMPRVHRDIDRCIRFIESFPRGKPADRRRDIHRGFETICALPELNPVEAYRPATGIELRRHNARQFAIIYAYLRPTDAYSSSVVSIRAVKHWRVRNIFLGVRESDSPAGDELRTSDHRTV